MEALTQLELNELDRAVTAGECGGADTTAMPTRVMRQLLNGYSIPVAAATSGRDLIERKLQNLRNAIRDIDHACSDAEDEVREVARAIGVEA